MMHHLSASYYYKLNVAFLLGFLGYTMYNYVARPQVFFDQHWIGKLYVGGQVVMLFGLWVFSHRQIRQIWLLKGGKEVAIETYSNFGLTHNRARILPVSYLQGNRAVMGRSMNLFQLEYTYKAPFSKLSRTKSFFYRPEKIFNQDLWQAVR